MLVVGIGVRAHEGREGGSSFVPGIVSIGRLTIIFFPFCIVAGGCMAIGLCLRPGPPSGAFGGPPILILGCLRILGMKGCPKDGAMICEGNPCPKGVMGIAVGGGKPG